MGKWAGNRLKNGLLHGIFDAPYASCYIVGMRRGGNVFPFCFWSSKRQLRMLPVTWVVWDSLLVSNGHVCQVKWKNKNKKYHWTPNQKWLHVEKQKVFPPQIPQTLPRQGAQALSSQLLWEEYTWRTGAAIIRVAPLATTACGVLRALQHQSTSSSAWLHAAMRPASQGMIYSALSRPQTYLNFRL